jgi:pantoate--beta-alanine ligase
VNLKTVTSISDLENLLGDMNRGTPKTGFVPTLGALHDGHISLIERAKRETDLTVVSIFVNPLQFTGEGFRDYPRDIESDSVKVEKAGVDILFTPGTDEFFPPGYQAELSLPDLFKTLETQKIVWHYKGVLAVVLKFFNIVRPDYAYFGMKDPHQLVLIKKMCRDLNLPVEIVSCETVREGDGLAKSSRNGLLSPDERAVAPVIYKALRLAVAEIERNGVTGLQTSMKILRETIEREPLARIEHIEISDEETLEPAGLGSTSAFAYAAVSIGGKRLTDNVRIRLNQT